jgi:hypothetical protein
MSELEVLTVGRISIDLYCGQIGAGWTEVPSAVEASDLVEAMPA